MSKKDDGGPAFPFPVLHGNGAPNGMSLRDYFAAKAMQSVISGTRPGGWSIGIGGNDNAHIAEIAYSLADSMIETRSQP